MTHSVNVTVTITVSGLHCQPAAGPPGGYPDRTFTGKRRRACRPVVNHSHDQPPTFLDTQESGQ